MTGLNELVFSKMYKLACAPIKDSDQPVYVHSLIRVFDGHSFGSQGPTIFGTENVI